MVYGEYMKQRIVSFHNHGSSIARALGREGISVSRVGVHKLLVKYQGNGGSSEALGDPGKLQEP